MTTTTVRVEWNTCLLTGSAELEVAPEHLDELLARLDTVAGAVSA
jgi:hypothetical protein